jgi:hypothetical protein
MHLSRLMVSYAALTGAAGAMSAQTIRSRSADTAVYAAVIQWTRPHPRLVADHTMPGDSPAWTAEGFRRLDTARVDLPAVGVALPNEATWVPLPPLPIDPPMRPDSALTKYCAALRPDAEVTAFSAVWWNPAHTVARVSVARVPCSGRGSGDDVLELARRNGVWRVASQRSVYH